LIAKTASLATHNFAAKTGLLLTPQFSSENYFATETTIQQQKLIRC
jgi:hypothetical protein